MLGCNWGHIPIPEATVAAEAARKAKWRAESAAAASFEDGTEPNGDDEPVDIGDDTDGLLYRWPRTGRTITKKRPK